jgi:HEAT repeat protein
MAHTEEDSAVGKLAAIAKRGPELEDLDWFVQLACGASPRIASVALHCISKLGPRAARVVPQLAELLDRNRETRLGGRVAQAIASMGGAAEAAVSHLKAAKRSSNSWVRKEAREALASIESRAERKTTN